VLAIAAGFVLDKLVVANAGGAVATVGIWVSLLAHGVVTSEAYVTPIAAQLIVVGMWMRHESRRSNSWVAYGPAIVLLTASAIVERISGGSAWHSLFAGAVATIAVIAGGSRRLAAPLVLGTAALVVVVGRESLDAAAGLPTWAWLAAGGSTLIGAAVAMERRDVSPVEAGRRIVDVVATNFQ
jgi:hypothetical protein